MQPRKKLMRAHQCKAPLKGATFRNRKTREVAVNYTKERMHSPDTRCFTGIKATRQDIQDYIDKHGVTLLTNGGKLR